MAVQKHGDQGIRGEHCHLRELLQSVHKTLAARRTGRDTIVAMLHELAKEVLEHFEHEETGGYFADAIDIAPRLSERAEELLGQHPCLAEQLAVMRRHADRAESNDRWWSELHRKFSEFSDCFRAHEAAENVLLLEAYNDDIGAED